MKKESREEAVARPEALNPTVPDSLKDMKDLVRELWSDNIRLIDEVRKLRYAIAELKYDNAMLKAEPKTKLLDKAGVEHEVVDIFKGK